MAYFSQLNAGFSTLMICDASYQFYKGRITVNQLAFAAALLVSNIAAQSFLEYSEFGSENSFLSNSAKIVTGCGITQLLAFFIYNKKPRVDPLRRPVVPQPIFRDIIIKSSVEAA